MNYDLTVKEFIDIVNKNLESLKGKNPMEYYNGISELVKNTIENMEIDLLDYSVNLDFCQLSFTSYHTGKELVFATIRSTYKQDKRTSTGYGNKLESVEAKLIDNIPIDWALLDLKQYMEYNEAKELYIALMEEQKKLVKQYEENKKMLKNYVDAMRLEAYDTNTECEVDEYYRKIREVEF